jgi:hypothetical protein
VLTMATSLTAGTGWTARCGSLTVVVVALPGTKMALKFVNKSKTKLKNFLREVSITNSLSSSPFIIKVFDVVFETEECYVFAQEYAPAGDLFDIIPPQVLQRVAERGEMGFGAASVWKPGRSWINRQAGYCMRTCHTSNPSNWEVKQRQEDHGFCTILG